MKTAATLLMLAALFAATSCDRAGDAAAERVVEKEAEKRGRPVQIDIDREGKSITVTLEEETSESH